MNVGNIQGGEGPWMNQFWVSGVRACWVFAPVKNLGTPHMAFCSRMFIEAPGKSPPQVPKP